jgi:hypothetical protein
MPDEFAVHEVSAVIRPFAEGPTAPSCVVQPSNSVQLWGICWKSLCGGGTTGRCGTAAIFLRQMLLSARPSSPEFHFC